MAQEAERLSSRANLLGLVLKVETERAEKYHNILLQLAGGGNALRFSRVPEGALTSCPTAGAPLEQAISRLPAEQGGPEVDRNNQAEVEGSVTVAAQSSASAVRPSARSTRVESSDRLPTSTGGPSSASRPATTRGRRSASHGRSARSPKRMLLHSSSIRPTPTVNGPVQPQRTGGQSSQQRTVPTPSPFVLTGATEIGSFISAVEILTLARAGLTPLELTRAEVIRSEETPGITWGDACGLFGGGWRAEWAECQRIPGYRDKMFLCADHRAQPYLPTGTGKPGLILCPPTGSSTPEDDNVSFQVLSCSPQDSLLYYQGEYTKVPLRQIQVSFCDLPVACRKIWVKRISVMRSPTHAATRARIKLRNEFNREPSVAKIQEYLLHHPTAPVTHREVSAALRAGEEKILCYGIQCTTYDSNLATIIQRHSISSNRDN